MPGYDDNAARANYYRPGSAADSETPRANGIAAAVTLMIILVALPAMPVDTNVWAGIAVVMWVFCTFAFLGVGIWAARIKQDPAASVADLLPQRVIGWMIGLAATLPLVMLIPL